MQMVASKVTKVVSMLLGLMLIASTSFAMTFSQPQELGWFGTGQAGLGTGGFSVKNATANNGNYWRKYHSNNTYSYEKGVAKFGNGQDALCVYYNMNNRQTPMYLGTTSKINLLPIESMRTLSQDVFKIATDGDVTIYALRFWYGPEKSYTVVGVRKDGKIVKYFDTDVITKNYYGEELSNCKEFIVSGDTITARIRNIGGKGTAIFRFKWDERAQWFGVEQVN